MPKPVFLNLDDDINVDYRETIKYYALSDEHHVDYEVYFVISGKVEITINEKKHVAGPNTIIVISTLEQHRYTILEYPYRRFVLMFKENYLRVFENDSKLLSIFKHGSKPNNQLIMLDQEQGNTVRDIYDSMYQEYNRGNPYWDKQIKALLLQLVIHLYRISPKSFPLSNPDTVSKSIVYDIEKYIADHFTEHINLKDTADLFHTNMHYLCHIFKQNTGTTFIIYLTNCRLSYAKELLATTDRSIQDISMHSGFGSLNHFIKTFKKHENLSPSQYRNGIKYKRNEQ